jgi:Holliday junction resolvase RusA-like endonuclease
MTAAMQEKNLTDSTFPLQGAVFLGCSFYMPRPKSHFKKTGALKESSPDWHTNKPDSDNLLKAVKDALTNCQIWRDDAQVAKVRVAKSYVNLKDCSPGVQITIGALP